ncbi:hypothetical protein D1872_316790 [compost metagenome]
MTLEQKEKITSDTVDELLNKLNVNPTENELKLIKILVHEGIRLMNTSIAATPVTK